MSVSSRSIPIAHARGARCGTLYGREISLTPFKHFPFSVTVKDGRGRLVGAFPATSREDAESLVARVLEALEDEESKKAS